MTRVLLTGAFGLIGGPTLAAFKAHGLEVTALSLVDPGPQGDDVDRLFVGDAGDVDLVRTALADVDAVVHLAALPSPRHGAPVDVFAGNTRATFVVLYEAARAGITKAVIASSYSILGLPFAERELHPPYFPLDDNTPLQVEDCYALSKQCDEATAHMVHGRYGINVIAMRFPFVCTDEMRDHRLKITLEDPANAAREAWAYLHVKDAAESLYQATRAEVQGVHSIFLAAPETLAPYPTEDLIHRYHPNSEIRTQLPGRTTPIDLKPAQQLIGFEPKHLTKLTEEPLP
jgi:nucleoside-diphosphate-sugar epimerase